MLLSVSKWRRINYYEERPRRNTPPNTIFSGNGNGLKNFAFLSTREQKNVHIVYSLSVPCGDRGQKKTEKTKGLQRGILKTGVLHKEFCAQSLWENLKCDNKRKNIRSLHRDAFLRMRVCKTRLCAGECV